MTMNRQWKYLFVLVWFSYLLIAGVLLFTRGFLLSRDTQKDVASCLPTKIINKCPTITDNSTFSKSSNTSFKDDISSNGCRQEEYVWTRNYGNDDLLLCHDQVAKVVLIVIDAFKYDFAVYDEKLSDAERIPNFKNKLPVIHEALLSNPHQAKLFKFIADPPTTTMQRLKALTTGSLPTFIDLGSNFATPEIDEDNLLDQLKRHNKSTVFLGDDTWTSLYPNRFIREYSFPSFNVWDLDTVDTGIMNNLLPEVKKSDWTLLVAHFLGVDHCGHRFGPYHSEMSRKLTEMNAMIKSVITAIDNNTIVFVIGDHGMTSTGDHGGDSESEVTAAMFVYSGFPLVSNFEDDTVSQVDLVPTLAAILGIPIPFSNLGSIILSSLPVLDWRTHLDILWHNVQQMTRYIQLYSQSSNQFSPEKLSSLSLNHSQLRDAIQLIKTEETFSQFVLHAKSYLVEVRLMCAEVWVQFDPNCMSRGLLLTFLTLFLCYLIIAGIPTDSFNHVLNSSFLCLGYGGVFVAAVCSYMGSYLGFVENSELTFYFTSGLISIFVMTIFVLQNWSAIASNLHDQKLLEDWTSIAGRIVVLLSLCVMFSNSFVVEEATVLSYFLATLVWLLVYNFKSIQQIVTINTKLKGFEKQTLALLKIQLTPARLKLVLLSLFFSVILRLSQYYWRCREEQVDCESFVSSKSNSSATFIGGKYRNAECLFTLVCLALMATIVRIWMRCCGNLVGFSCTEILARYGPTVLVVCTGGFWISQSLPKITKVKLFLPWQLQFLPWIIYSIVIGTIVSLFIEPLCVYTVPKNDDVSAIHGEGNKIPLLFNQMKDLMKERVSTSEKDKFTPIVYGLATVYSAAFVILSLFSFLLVSLLLGDVLSPSVVLLFAAGAVLLVILSVVRYEKALFVGQLFNVPWSTVVCWSLLSSYFFYGTGHQPTFPGIQWDAAFVGTGGQFSNHIIPAVLIGINTFASQLLVALALPLLLITPFTLHVMFPSLLTRWGDVGIGDKEVEIKRGEMALYEHQDLMYRGMFTLSTKFILIHGVRMFACMMAATVHCRHLMVWKIFAPKLIFEGLGLFVTLPTIILVYLLVMRITSRIESLLDNLDRQR